jgi:hypothetical protein
MRLRACLVVLCVAAAQVQGQVLELPPRAVNAVGGQAFAADVAALELRDREERIYDEIASGNVPSWLRRLVPVNMKRELDHHEVTVTFWVTPDYLAVGSDSDYFLMPMSPHLAQHIADRVGASLPTPPMVDATWQTAAVQLGPDSIAPSAAMITVPVFADHNQLIRTRRDNNSAPPGVLVAGHKKDVVLTSRLDSLPGRVAIYGWHLPRGQPIQPLNTWHTTGHVDYSHGIRLVHSHVEIDGMRQDIRDLLRDPQRAALISDDGVMQKGRYELSWP